MGVCTTSLLAVPELAIAKRENVLQQAALKSVVLDICRMYFAYEMRLRGGIIGNSACIVGYKASFLSLLIVLVPGTWYLVQIIIIIILFSVLLAAAPY